MLDYISDEAYELERDTRLEQEMDYSDAQEMKMKAEQSNFLKLLVAQNPIFKSHVSVEKLTEQHDHYYHNFASTIEQHKFMLELEFLYHEICKTENRDLLESYFVMLSSITKI